MKEILARYIGQTIGLNFKKPDKFHPVTLVAVRDDYFSVQAAEHRPVGHFPFCQVINVLESEAGVPIDSFGVFKAPRVPLVVQTYAMPSGTMVGVMFAI